MSKYLLLLATFFLIIECQQSNEFRYSDFEYFRIKLPIDYNIKGLNSPDSYAATIELNSGNLTFDYGLYSPKMTLSPAEYLKERAWEQEDKFIMSYVMNPFPEFQQLKDSGGYYNATYNIAKYLRTESASLYPLTNFKEYSFKDSLMRYQFKLPQKFSEFEFYITESNSIFKRVFIANDLNKHSSGVYILNKNSCTDELNCYEQLSIWTGDSVNIERTILKEILNSAELIDAR
jgi:hypothetical protein